VRGRAAGRTGGVRPGSAADATVLGDLGGASFTHYGVTSTFTPGDRRFAEVYRIARVDLDPQGATR